MKRILIGLSIFTILLFSIFTTSNSSVNADTVLYPLYQLDGSEIPQESHTFDYVVSPNTVGNLYIEFTDTPSNVFYDGEEIDTSKTFFKEMSFSTDTTSYSFTLSTNPSEFLVDSISSVKFYGGIPTIKVSEVEVVDQNPLLVDETDTTYLHVDFDTKDLIIADNNLSIEFPNGVVPDESKQFFLDNDYTFSDNMLNITDANINSGIYIPIDLGSVLEAEFTLNGTYVSSLGLNTGGIMESTISYDGLLTTFENNIQSYAQASSVSTLSSEVSLLNADDTYKFQFTDKDIISNSNDPYVTGYDLSNYYTLTNDQNLFYSDFQFDSDEDFSFQIPYMQEDEFNEFQIYLTEQNSYNGTGNTFDPYSESIFSDYTYYEDDNVRGTGSAYQYYLAQKGFDSLSVNFSEDHLSYGFNDSSVDDGSFGNSINGMKFDNTLDDSIYFYQFDWDSTNKIMSIGINTIDYHEEDDYSPADTADKIVSNRANNELVSYVELSKVDLSSYDFTPTSFLMTTNNANGDRLYLPKINGTRYFSEISFENSPIYFDLPKKVADMPSNETIIDFATPIIRNYKNGQLVNTVHPDYSTGNDYKINSTFIESLGEVAYDPGIIQSGIHHFNLQAKQTIDDQIVYQVQSLPLYMGMLPEYSIELQVQSPVLYPVGVFIEPTDYAGFESEATLYKSNGSTYDLVGDISQYTELYDFSALNYNVKGNYTVYYRTAFPNPDTGEYIFKTISQTIKVDDPVLDYGDLPKSYGDAASVGEASKTFQIGYNLDSNNQSYIDKEFYPYYDELAEGDDKYGIDDELGYLNQSPEDLTGINYQIDSIRFDIPYIASSASQICMWLDLDGSGNFSSAEGQCAKGVPVKHGNFGTVAFTYDLTQVSKNIEPNTKVGMRLKISANSNLGVNDFAKVDESNVGEVEDYMVDIYGPRNEAEICIDTAVKSPSLVIKDVNTKSGDIVITADIPSSYAPGYVYTNAKVTISSNASLSFDAKRGDSAIISVTKPKNSSISTLDVTVRDSSGNPINAPFTTGFWGIDDGAYVKNTTPTFKGNYDDSYLQVNGDNIGSISLDTTSDVVSGGQFIYTVEDVATANPSTYLWMIPSLYYAADFSFESNADVFYFTMGYNSAALTLPIEDCIENFGANAYLTVLGDKLTDANLYTNYPFDYESENIAIPYYDNLESFSHVFEIPDGSSFVDGDNKVEVYRRPFTSNYSSGGVWEEVDPTSYTQTMYTPTTEQINNGISGISSVTFNDPIANGTYGYEYKFIYHMQLNEEYTYRVNSDGTKELKTGEEVTFKTYLYYDKADSFTLDVSKSGTALEEFDYAGDEAYYLNPVTVTVREPFSMLVNTTMSDDVIDIYTSGTQNYYTLTYNNCNSCEGVTAKTYLPQGDSEINVPIPNISQLSLNGSNQFDKYEDLTLTIYDNDLKALEIPIYRWYPSELSQSVASVDELKDFNDSLNPIEQQHYVRMGYSGYLQTFYARETLNVLDLDTVDVVDDGKLSVNPGISITINNGWPSPDWTFIDETQMKTYSDAENYIDLTDEVVKVLIPTILFDDSLAVKKQNINGTDYGVVDFVFNEIPINGNSQVNYEANLDSKYVIEKYSGNIYNLEYEQDCSINGVCTSDNKYGRPTDDPVMIMQGYNDNEDEDLIISDYLNSEMLLKTDLSLLGDNYNYIIDISNLGLNDSSIEVNLEFYYDSLMVSYKKDTGKQYIKRTDVEDVIKACIEEDSCSDEYQELFSGKIYSTNKVRNAINNDITKLTDSVKISEWLDSYYE